MRLLFRYQFRLMGGHVTSRRKVYQSCPLMRHALNGTEQQVNLAGGDIATMNVRVAIELIMLILQVILFVMNFIR